MIYRDHIWLNNRCQRCGMASHWEGAKHSCEGVGTSIETAKQQKANRDRRRWKRISASPELLDVKRDYQRALLGGER